MLFCFLTPLRRRLACVAMYVRLPQVRDAVSARVVKDWSFAEAAMVVVLRSRIAQ